MKAFALIHQNQATLKQSTSGGAFSALAEVVFRRGGLVVGAVYAPDLSIEHRVAESLEDLAPMRGVKYAIGTIGKAVYEQIDTALSTGRLVMFTGLPCQVAALRKRYGTRENLLLVDLLCFGAPPQKLWLKYVRWVEQMKGKKLQSINPRDKNLGWGRKTYYSYHWQDGSTTRQLSLFSPYAQAFYSTLGFRKCCFSCRFRGDQHQSDVTIGDCWGAEELPISAAQRAQGVSLVVCHNSKGEEAISACDCTNLPVDEALIRAQNKPFFDSPIEKAEWAQFQVDSEQLSWAELIQKYRLQISRFAYIKSCIKSCLKRGIR